MITMGEQTLWIIRKTARRWFVFVLIAFPASAPAETSTQLWGSVILGHQKSERLYIEVEIQPKAQISGGKRWRNIDATWLAEYYPNKWFDLTGELVTGYTDQTNKVSSFEVTPKVGLRVHLAEQTLKETDYRWTRYIERLPLKRFYLATWLRLEYRNLFYSEEQAASHEWRFRVRPEIKVALNNPSLGDDGTLFGRTDVEFFVPIGNDIPERFNNKIRFRIGPGYRINTKKKIELLFMYDLNRESRLLEFEEDAYMLDLRLTVLF